MCIIKASGNTYPLLQHKWILEAQSKFSELKYRILDNVLVAKNPNIERLFKALAKPLESHQLHVNKNRPNDYKDDTLEAWIALNTGNLSEGIRLSKLTKGRQGKDRRYHVARVQILSSCYALNGQEVEALELMHEALVLSKKIKMKNYAYSIGGMLVLYMISLDYKVNKDLFLELMQNNVPLKTQQRFEKARVSVLENGFTVKTCNWNSSSGFLQLMATRFPWLL